jgi:hypothetical protein
LGDEREDEGGRIHTSIIMLMHQRMQT